MTQYFIKLLSENKFIICALGNLHYQSSREKLEPEPGFESEVGDSNSGSGSNFPVEI